MVAMASSLMNGERFVVVFFISQILFSTPFSLLYEAVSLTLLSLFALFVEIAVEFSSDSLSPFKSRPGASSGILLGAVTLPGLMVSRLIQLLRAVSLHEVGTKELEYLQLQYWATSASCFGVLVLLYIILCHQPNNNHSIYSQSNWSTKFSLISAALYAVMCCVCFATKLHNGSYTLLMLLWVLCHGLAAVKLIQHFLHTFPACASIGEALLVTTGLVVYFGDMFACTVAKVNEYLTSSENIFVQIVSKRSEISTIIQGMLLGLILFPLFFKLSLHIWELYTCSAQVEARENHEIGRTVIFYASLAFILILIIPLWMQFVQDFPVHPLIWYMPSFIIFIMPLFVLIILSDLEVEDFGYDRFSLIWELVEKSDMLC
ncbi:unnamed protein product [Ilex paraguariensis]|uniref:dolichol kinase n=1 Tax=Ilex paraguariensis TaxID=185542 RepID=A0ABC8SNN0_9AQUA